ncbi:hypothetical protein [Symbiopectobacterium sp. RP]|uniref:hypothetical protein n=1 Tax=Symbiopectobacterium sp. RP TaxID=3248553 RepID=UPI003D27F8C2
MSMNFLTKQVVIKASQTFNNPGGMMTRIKSAADIVPIPALATNNAAASRELCAGNNMARP